MNSFRQIQVVLLLFILFTNTVSAEEQLNKTQTLSDIEQTDQSNLLNSEQSLPVDDRIISLLELSQNDPLAAAQLLPKITEISHNFNVAEKYLMFLVRALLIIDEKEAHKAINWLKKAILLEDKIAHEQLIQPTFHQLNKVLASKYAQISQFKLAYEQKKQLLR